MDLMSNFLMIKNWIVSLLAQKTNYSC